MSELLDEVSRCIKQHNVKMLSDLLENHCHTICTMKDGNGQGMLEKALDFEFSDCAALLVEYGADTNAVSSNGVPLWDIVIQIEQSSLLKLFFENGLSVDRTAIIQCLIEYDMDEDHKASLEAVIQQCCTA